MNSDSLQKIGDMASEVSRLANEKKEASDVQEDIEELVKQMQDELSD